MARGDALIQDIGLTSALWQVLHAIQDAPLPVAQIARNVGITRQSVLRTVNALKKKGLVALRDNPNHQRAKLVEMLEEGKKRLDIATARQIHMANAEAEGMDLHTLQNTIILMRSLRGETVPNTLNSPPHMLDDTGL
ncbi:MAG: MarR family transcriptional regulator [Desulfovibrionaceae bacterium]